MTRAEAIKLLVNATYSEEWQGNEQLAKAQHMAIEALEQEPKHGEWVKDEYDISRCSECNCINNTFYRNYCPNCGARMEG